MAVIDQCYGLIEKGNAHRDRLDSFIKARFQALLVEEGKSGDTAYSYDIADSVLHLALENVSQAINKARHLYEFKNDAFDINFAIVEFHGYFTLIATGKVNEFHGGPGMQA